MPKRILFIDGREIHQIGDFVSVCFNTKEQKSQQGNRTIIEQVRSGEPYIDFCWIRESGGEIWIREDLTIDGGLRLEPATLVAKELQEAIVYMEALLNARN